MVKTYKIRISLYFSREGFLDAIAWAEKSGLRHKGLFPFIKKNKLGVDVEIPNTKSMAKFFHFLLKAYKETEAERTLRLAQIQAKEREIAAEKEKLGIK